MFPNILVSKQYACIGVLSNYDDYEQELLNNLTQNRSNTNVVTK